MTYEEMADAIADAASIPRSLFRALVQTESGWNPYAIGQKGEIGLTQLLPTTAHELGVNAWDVEQNLKGGAAYLASQFKRFGNWTSALAAYNAGPGNIAAGSQYAKTVLATQQEIIKNAPTLDKPDVAAQPQDWYHGSVLEQGIDWLGDLLGKTGPEIFGTPNLGSEKGGQDILGKTGPELLGTPALGKDFAKYAMATILVVVSISIAVYVLAIRGSETAAQVVKKNVS